MAEEVIVNIIHKEDGEEKKQVAEKDVDLKLDLDAVEVEHEKTYVSLRGAYLGEDDGFEDSKVYMHDGNLVLEFDCEDIYQFDPEKLLSVLLKAVQL